MPPVPERNLLGTYSETTGITPAKIAMKIGMRLRSEGARSPMKIPKIGRIANMTTIATRPKSRFIVFS